MPAVSVGGTSSSAPLPQQDDRITPVRPSLSDQVRPSTTPLVPYHFEGKASDKTQDTLKTRQHRLTALIKDLGKKSPDNDPIGYARQHMALEATVLDFAPGTSFQDIQKHLAELGGTPHPMLSGQEETEAFAKDFNAYLGMSKADRKESGGFAAVWDKHCGRVGNTLGAYHSLCQEVIDNTPEGDDRKSLQSSHAAFRDYAKGVTQAMAKDMPERLDTFLESRIAHAQQATSNEDLSEAERNQASAELTQLNTVKEELGKFVNKEDDNPSALAKATKKNEALDTALKNVAREDYIAELKTHSGFLTGLAVFADAGIPQGFASSGHFGASTAAIDEVLEGTHLAAHTAGTSVVLGSAHKTISDSARPIIQTIVDKTVGSGLEKVDPMSVYPKPLQDITVGGRRVANPQHEALDKAQEDKRADFLRTQNANNFGTISGDFMGYVAFGAAHAVREALNQFTTLNASGITARSIASAVGGTLMAGGQAVAKYSQSHGDEKIPTYRVKNETREWKELLPKAFAESKKTVPMNMANFSDYLTRVLGVSGGIAMRNAVANAAEAGEDAEALEKTQQIIATFFSSGLTLLPFFANSVAAPLENKALNDGEDDLTARANVAWQNVTNPNRDSLPHTQPPGARRYAENTYHVTRGISQAVPQATVAGINIGAEWIKSVATKPKAPAAEDNFELAERGEAPPQGGPSNEPTPTTRPS